MDVAPTILDTERIIRLGLEGGDGTYDAVNIETPDGKKINDLSMGSYDVVVTVGPSFTTQRTEARQSMSEFLQYYPDAGPVIGDVYAELMDWPGADRMAKRLKFLIPPDLRQEIEKEEAATSGKPAPEQMEEQQAPPPDPIMEAKLQQEMLKIQQMQMQVEQEKMKLEGIMLENEMKRKELLTPPEPVSTGGEK